MLAFSVPSFFLFVCFVIYIHIADFHISISHAIINVTFYIDVTPFHVNNIAKKTCKNSSLKKNRKKKLPFN